MSQCSFDARSDIPTLVEANAEPGGGTVVSYDAWAGSAAKRFAVVKCNVKDGRHICRFADLVGWLAKHDDHKYEVISGDKPARLFLDVEWPSLRGRSTLHVAVCSRRVLLRVECVRQAGRTVVSPADEQQAVIPRGVSRCCVQSVCTDMKLFVLGFVRWLVEEHESGASLTYEKTLKNGKIVPITVVDTAVYTSNRNFRMLGQSKLTDKTRTPHVDGRRHCGGNRHGGAT